LYLTVLILIPGRYKFIYSWGWKTCANLSEENCSKLPSVTASACGWASFTPTSQKVNKNGSLVFWI